MNTTVDLNCTFRLLLGRLDFNSYGIDIYSLEQA